MIMLKTIKKGKRAYTKPKQFLSKSKNRFVKDLTDFYSDYPIYFEKETNKI